MACLISRGDVSACSNFCGKRLTQSPEMRNRKCAEYNVRQDIDRRTGVQEADIVDTGLLRSVVPGARNRSALENRDEDATYPQTSSNKQCDVHDESKRWCLNEAQVRRDDCKLCQSNGESIQYLANKEVLQSISSKFYLKSHPSCLPICSFSPSRKSSLMGRSRYDFQGLVE